MILGRKLTHPLVLLLAVLLLALPVSAMPGFLVGKQDAKRIVHSTQIVLMKSGERTVATVMADYDGPADTFAVVMPLPKDVTMDRIRTLKRDSVERVENLSAPRVFHFWEKDPCELGKAIQVWERDLRVKPGGASMLGEGMIDFSGGKRKAPKELTWHLEIETKDGEYTMALLMAPESEEGEGEEGDKPSSPDTKSKAKAKPAAKSKAKPAKQGAAKGKSDKTAGGDAGAEAEEEAEVELPPSTEWAAWLKQKGYQVSPEAEAALAPYVQAGMNVLIAEVDPRKMELIGGGRAQLSPIQYYTDLPMTKLPVTLGLLNLDQAQELLVYTLHRDQRFEVGNYPDITPPTNIELRERLGKLWVQERIGEVYANIHDRLVKQHPGSFLVEFAWPTETCGEPCPSDKLQLWELLTLGGDELDMALPDEVRNPEPTPLTDEEEKDFKSELEAVERKDRKKFKKEREAERREVARRQALAERHKYILSRVHARYDREFLKQDVELVPGKPLEGGAAIPEGPEGMLPRDIRPSDKNKLQIRFVTLHPWPGVLKCEKPERWRWGLEWRSVRRLNKIWTAVDLTRRPRDRMKPEEVFLSPVPELGIVPQAEPADAGADAGPEPEPESKGGCGCRLAAGGAPRGSGALWGLLAAVGFMLGRRRR